jgi:hypothetical protein
MFQRIVLTIAVVILIIILTLVALLLWKSHSSAQYPPVISPCPDYYVQKPDGTCVRTEGITGLQVQPSCQTLSFSGSAFKGAKGLCARRKRANDCGLTWDGITNSDTVC